MSPPDAGLSLPDPPAPQRVGRGHAVLHWAWQRRRWIYAAWMLIAVTRIPARTGFRLTWPACDARLAAENLGLSLTKVPHVLLFGGFFLLTLIQFDQPDRRAVAWSFAATAIFSLLIELEQGATRTGNCRLTDIAPNLLGAFIAAALVMGAVKLDRRLNARGWRA